MQRMNGLYDMVYIPNEELKQACIATLKRMRELLDEPKNWCQQAIAKTVTGKSVDVWDEDVVSLCLVGAKEKSIWDSEDDKGVDIGLSDARNKYTISGLVSAVLEYELGKPAVDFNDDPDTEHADVLALIDASITYFSSAPISNKG